MSKNHEEFEFINKNTISHTSHVLFGNMMKESLIRLNLEVESGYEVGKGPPKLDVLIIRRSGKQWSKAQLEYLPDGIRQSHCEHVILELKYTESINRIAIYHTLGYLSSYVKLKSLKVDNVCAFIVSSKTPRKTFLKQIGFQKTDIKGIYSRPKDYLLSPIQLISLNDLSNEPYNLWIKLFSSKQSQRLSVLRNLVALDLRRINQGLTKIFLKIINFWSMTGEITMKKIKQEVLRDTIELTREEIDFCISLFDIKLEDVIKQKKFKTEDMLKLLKPEDRLQGLKPEDRLQGLKPEDRLQGLKLEDRLQGLKPEDRLQGLKPEDRLQGLKPEDRLKGLDIETIEAYLAKMKRQMKVK